MSLRKVSIDGYGMGFHRRNVAAIMKGDKAEERKAAAAAKRARRAEKRARDFYHHEDWTIVNQQGSS